MIFVNLFIFSSFFQAQSILLCRVKRGFADLVGVRGIEPPASRTRIARSTDDLHPELMFTFWARSIVPLQRIRNNCIVNCGKIQIDQGASA